MTFRDAHDALDSLLNGAPEFGEVSLKVIYHEGKITRLERAVVEKVAANEASGHPGSGRGNVCSNAR
ncbi:hypothetical protein TRIP_E60005 [uncultured Spirochaetota bacterium]|jgi:hypothetical protein|uniref:Uncharacterized protein n=1 Tax=uncultured Spirochaetota bacterium TaxID=460511 RepID=A0A652ZZD0_9SPIR|nr:hypothetical protein TRIP_E60005 [uncultured Spirochaetota bacterium]